MIKLSELTNDTMLCIETNFSDFIVMDKGDFLTSPHFLDYPICPFPSVTIADIDIAPFKLDDVLAYIKESSEAYDDWDLDVYYSLKDLPETAAFIRRANEVFQNHPIYWEGEKVEIDMLPEVRGDKN